jgi:hypothetical protein
MNEVPDIGGILEYKDARGLAVRITVDHIAVAQHHLDVETKAGKVHPTYTPVYQPHAFGMEAAT